jgi:hypothetical protein
MTCIAGASLVGRFAAGWRSSSYDLGFQVVLALAVLGFFCIASIPLGRRVAA